MIDPTFYKAQFGEDKILLKHFADISSGYYVEVGACDGEYASNTFLFEKLGWTGLLIEPIPAMANKCRQIRPNSKIIECLAAAPDSPKELEFEVVKGWEALSARTLNRERFHDYKPEIEKISVSARTLDSILTEAKPAKIHFMTIDVEGFEWDVLKGFTIANWQPEIVIIERWSPIPDKRIMDYMHANNYRFRRTTGSINDWFYSSDSETVNSLSYKASLLLNLYLPTHTINTAKKSAKSLLGR